jgi:DNA-binding CsgD family transcriptional regulator
MLAAAGLSPTSLEELTRGLSFDARSVKRMRRVYWDDFCTFIERAEQAVGGPERLEELAARSFHSAVRKEWGAIFRAFVSPRALYRFWFERVNPLVFPNTDFGFAVLGDGRLRLSGRLRPYARPCPAFVRIAVGSVRGMPQHLGLPMAEVAVDAPDDRTLVLIVRPPESRTLMALAKRVDAASLQRAAVRLLRIYSDDSRTRSDSMVEIGALGRDLARHLDLPSLTVALERALGKLGWQGVTLQNGERDATARPAPGAHILPLTSSGTEIGRVIVHGTADLALVEELLPWLTIAVENARTFGPLTRPEAQRPEAAAAARLLELTPRQSEVFAPLVRGLSNKEISAVIGCAEKTVELHVTQILQKARVQGRTQLIARFWAGELGDSCRVGRSDPTR